MSLFSEITTKAKGNALADLSAKQVVLVTLLTYMPLI